MKIINEFVLIFTLLLISGGAGASPENKVDAYMYLINQYEKVELNRLRGLDSYKRIYSICSTPLEFSKLQYVYSSASQVMSLATGSEVELNHISKSHKGISRLLYEDLESQGFHQAIKDCKYSLNQTKMLIASLLILDSSGKLLGTVGVIFSFRFARKILGAIKKKSLSLYYGVIASGVAGSFYEVFNKFRPETVDDSSSTDILITSVEDLEHLYDEGVDNNDIEEFSLLIIKQLESKIKRLELILEEDVIEESDRQEVIKELESLYIKVEAIKLV